MLARVINHVVDTYLSRLAINQLAPLTVIHPATNLGQTSQPLSVREIFDGLIWATPKHRTPARIKAFRRYGDERFQDSTKLWKVARNLVNCSECGAFHEVHTICRSCYKKVEEESKAIIEGIRSAWKGEAIDKEVQVLYQGETAQVSGQKRIVELERPRPLWFETNLSQRSTNTKRSIGGPPTEMVDRVVREKETISGGDKSS